jgi:hypothetical protein
VGSGDCAFCAPVLEILREADIPWRPVAHTTNVNAQYATAEADLAVMAMLPSTAPQALEVLGPRSGLPVLPAFSITLHLPKTSGSQVARELARFIRGSIVGKRLAA